MNKNSRKTILTSLVVLLLLVGGYFTFKNYNQPQVVLGDKNVEIIVVDRDKKPVYEKIINTDANLLGEVIDQINADEKLFELEGEKDSEFGRFITKVNLVESIEGEFWVFDSENNKVCQTEAFCPGIDSLAIEDEDSFTFFLLEP